MPSRKQRQNEVISWFTFPFTIIAFFLFMKGIFDIIGLFIVMGIGLVLGLIAARYVPDMRKKENKNKNPYTGLPQKTSAKKPAKPSSSKKQTASAKSASSSEQIGKYGVRSDDEILQLPLEELSGLEFEQLVYLYFKGNGYKPEKTPESHDGGVDIIVRNKQDNAKIAVQVKHKAKSGNQINVKDIRELDGAKKNYGCYLTWFITSAGYTPDALRQADKYHMITWSKYEVENKIIPWKEREAVKRQVAAAKR
jgi:restriction system protein